MLLRNLRTSGKWLYMNSFHGVLWITHSQKQHLFLLFSKSIGKLDFDFRSVPEHNSGSSGNPSSRRFCANDQFRFVSHLMRL